MSKKRPWGFPTPEVPSSRSDASLPSSWRSVLRSRGTVRTGGEVRSWCGEHPQLDRARLEIVLRVFLRGFDGAIDRCDFRSARYPQSPFQHWVLRLGLFLIPASFQIVRHDATNVWWDVWGELAFNSIYSFQTVSYRSFWTYMDSHPLRFDFSQGVSESPKAIALEAIWMV